MSKEEIGFIPVSFYYTASLMLKKKAFMSQLLNSDRRMSKVKLHYIFI